MKCDVFIFLLLQAAGAALAYVGAYVIKTYHSYDSFISDQYSIIPPIIIIAISVVMFIFGILGCCATIRESKFGLGCVSTLYTTNYSHLRFSKPSLRLILYFFQFFLIIMVIFAAEVAALVCAFIFQGRVSNL